MHGGDIYRNKVDIDFSVNISPYGIPPMVRAAVSESVMSIATYPDSYYEKLREEIGKSENVDKDFIICGNGASELIYTAIRAVAKATSDRKPASILVPCFSEYEEAALAAGYERINKVAIDLSKDFIPGDAELCKLINNSSVVVFGNPNNPTGKLLPIEWINSLITEAEKNGNYIVIDETFLPLTISKNDYDGIRSDYVIKIKAYTKSMAIPGVRLGYLICENNNISIIIKGMLPDWNVSIIAQNAGIACAESSKWLYDRLIDKDNGLVNLRNKLSEKLKEFGIRVYDSDTAFLLVNSDIDLYSELLRRGILIRDCAEFDGLGKGYYRIAVKGQRDNEYLIKNIKEIINGQETSECQARSNLDNRGLLSVEPAKIEKKSFEILSSELEARGITLEGDTAQIIKRCIHTTADFQYASTLHFSQNAVDIMKNLIREGAIIVTDTNMALSGINKSELKKYGGEVFCFMADPDIAREAKERGCTRATASMEHAAKLGKKIIFVVGNAPTALVTLCEMMDRGQYYPEFIIGVPVGFVNVEQAKEMVIDRNINHIVNRGRKGGSNVAAAIVNAVLYSMRDE